MTDHQTNELMEFALPDLRRMSVAEAYQVIDRFRQTALKQTGGDQHKALKLGLDYLIKQKLITGADKNIIERALSIASSCSASEPDDRITGEFDALLQEASENRDTSEASENFVLMMSQAGSTSAGVAVVGLIAMGFGAAIGGPAGAAIGVVVGVALGNCTESDD